VRGLLGLVIGLIVGAGAMYLTLRPPWGVRSHLVPSDAGMDPVAVLDGGPPGKPKGKRRPGGRGGTIAAPGAAPGGAAGGAGEVEETEPVVLTEADRRLEWRGDDVALPPTKQVDMSSGAEARSLDDAEINAVIAGQSDGVRGCVVQGATGTELRATITVKMLVDGSGRVTRSRLQAPRYLFEHGLLACAQRALGRMKFPATGAPTVVTLPVTLG
jgi:hypothetical protein